VLAIGSVARSSGCGAATFPGLATATGAGLTVAGRTIEADVARTFAGLAIEGGASAGAAAGVAYSIRGSGSGIGARALAVASRSPPIDTCGICIGLAGSIFGSA